MAEAIDAPSETVAGGGLSKEDAFKILSNDRRRHVLHYLENRPDDTAKLGDIARQIAAWENEIPLADVSSTERKRVYIALHQTHLPKMAESGVVEYDSDDNVVTLTAEAQDLRVYLDAGPASDRTWSHYYLGLGVVSFAIVAAAAAGVGPLDAVPAVGWAALIAGLFTLSGAVHAYVTRKNRLAVAGPKPGN